LWEKQSLRSAMSGYARFQTIIAPRGLRPHPARSRQERGYCLYAGLHGRLEVAFAASVYDTRELRPSLESGVRRRPNCPTREPSWRWCTWEITWRIASKPHRSH